MKVKNIDKLDGEISYLIVFNEEHINDQKYLSWLRDYEVMKTINRIEYIEKPIPFEEVQEYCHAVINSAEDIFLALYDKKEDLFIGTVRISKINRHANTADVGILIGDRTKWGKGIATDAIHTACSYLFNTLGVRKITAGCMQENIGMIKVFEKLGFEKEGVFRKQEKIEDRFCDHIYFGCFKSEFNM